MKLLCAAFAMSLSFTVCQAAGQAAPEPSSSAAAQADAKSAAPSAAAADAQADASADVQVVDVPGTKNPELRSYRSMSAGLDAFDEHHALAPNAKELRFVLRPRNATIALAGTTLRIAGGETSIPVPIEADGGFVLPRSQAAYDNDADLILNRKRGLFSGEADVRSPGVPPNMRRLGDLRLDCEVMVAIAKKEINFALRMVVYAAVGTDWCHIKKGKYGTEAPFLFDSVTLISGERRVTEQVGSHQRDFFAPVNDASWPDDTLIELHPSAPATLATYAAQPIFVRGSMDHWGSGVAFQRVDDTNYVADVALAKGKLEFKLAAKDYAALDLGAGAAGPAVADGQRKPLAWAGANLTRHVAEAGNYRFHLDVSKPDAPTISVSETPTTH